MIFITFVLVYAKQVIAKFRIIQPLFPLPFFKPGYVLNLISILIHLKAYFFFIFFSVPVDLCKISDFMFYAFGTQRNAFNLINHL
jgi:hypothetical protein